MNTQSLIHIFGEVLFDNFPDGSRVLGGAPFNVAWHLQAFGQLPNFISRVGDDAAGQEISDLMATWGMSRNSLQTDGTHPTGSVQVLIENNEPHYEIVPNSAYDFIASNLLSDKPTQGILYHGSLAVRNTVSCAALQSLKARHSGKIFIDVNLRPPWWQKDTLLALLADADWVKLNQAELDLLNPNQLDLETAMQTFCVRFGLETLVVTRGEQGAVALNRQKQFVSVLPATKVAVVDTVGAGDAFASVLLLGLNQDWPLKTTLERAQNFASAIIGKRGATVSDYGFYQVFYEQWGLSRVNSRSARLDL